MITIPPMLICISRTKLHRALVCPFEVIKHRKRLSGLRWALQGSPPALLDGSHRNNARSQLEKLHTLPTSVLQSLEVTGGAQQQGHSPWAAGEGAATTLDRQQEPRLGSTGQHPAAMCHLRRGIPSHCRNCWFAI